MLPEALSCVLRRPALIIECQVNARNERANTPGRHQRSDPNHKRNSQTFSALHPIISLGSAFRTCGMSPFIIR